MHRVLVLIALFGAFIRLDGAEHKFDFREEHENQMPPGFRSTVVGEGEPGAWNILLNAVPPLLPPLSANVPVVTRRPVLAQLAKDPTDEHFPLLIYDQEVFGDFTLTTRFKIVSGVREQMAGVAFRIQDEKNFYVVRASALGSNIRFYKVVNGERGPLLGPSVEIRRDAWYELTIECRANQIRCLLDGAELIPTLMDNSFATGKIGFWTKSDSVSYFADARIVYTPRVPYARTLVKDTLEKYPRLLGLKVFASSSGDPAIRIIASDNETELGQPGGKPEESVLRNGSIFYAKGKKSVTVVMPMRDNNGEPVAAVQVVMDSFPGQTEQNAIIRAMPVVKFMNSRIRHGKDLVQ